MYRLYMFMNSCDKVTDVSGYGSLNHNWFFLIMSLILLLILDMSCWRNMVLACWFCVALTLVMLHNYITCDVAQLYHLWWFWVFLVFFFSDLYSIPLAPKWDLTGNNHDLCTGRVISKVLYSDLLAPECPGLASIGQCAMDKTFSITIQSESDEMQELSGYALCR